MANDQERTRPQRVSRRETARQEDIDATKLPTRKDLGLVNEPIIPLIRSEGLPPSAGGATVSRGTGTTAASTPTTGRGTTGTTGGTTTGGGPATTQ
jgi:hypothetical protein